MKRLLALLGLYALLGLPAAALAQDNVSNQCLSSVYASLEKERLFFRSVLFGQKGASTLPQGAVRHDGEANSWIKTAEGEWKSYAPGFEGTTWSDTQMDSQGYPPRRTGLLEIKRAATSEMIPAMTQAMRALQCRLRFVCETAMRSRAADAPETFTVEVDGCIPFEARRVNACKDSQGALNSSLDPNALLVQVGVCEQAMQSVLTQEGDMLRLLVAYDAGYRSFAQFAGIVGGFSEALRQPVIDVLANTVRTLQFFGNTPCFSAQCDD